MASNSQTNSDGSPVKKGELRWWRCPVCQRKHIGMSQDICHNENCKMVKPKTEIATLDLDDSPFDDLGTITVDQMQAELTRIKEKYGTKAVLMFDAGHNNITCQVIPSKKVK